MIQTRRFRNKSLLEYATYPAVEFADEDNAVVGLSADITIGGVELNGGRCSSDIVCHLDVGHGVTLVDSEGGQSAFLRLEIDISHAVDREKRRNMLGHVVLHDGALQKHAPDLAEFLEHCANLDLTNVVRKPVDAEISFLLECWLSHIHLLELSVGRDKNFLLVFISWERLFVHLIGRESND